MCLAFNVGIRAGMPSCLALCARLRRQGPREVAAIAGYRDKVLMKERVAKAGVLYPSLVMKCTGDGSPSTTALNSLHAPLLNDKDIMEAMQVVSRHTMKRLCRRYEDSTV